MIEDAHVVMRARRLTRAEKAEEKETIVIREPEKCFWDSINPPYQAARRSR